MVLFDRGFASWGIIYKLRKLSIPYLIFWEKRGKWYSELFENMNDGEYVYVKREGIYNRDKTKYVVTCKTTNRSIICKEI